MRGLGLRRRDTSSLDKPWEGPPVVRKLDRSAMKVEGWGAGFRIEEEG